MICRAGSGEGGGLRILGRGILGRGILGAKGTVRRPNLCSQADLLWRQMQPVLFSFAATLKIQAKRVEKTPYAATWMNTAALSRSVEKSGEIRTGRRAPPPHTARGSHELFF